MKTIIRLAAAAAMTVLGALSCTKNFEGINTNPNKIGYDDIMAHNMFEPNLYLLGRDIQYHAYFFSHELAQTTAFTGGRTTQIYLYQLYDANFQSIWDCYARHGNDSDYMAKLGVKKDEQLFAAFGLIFKAYNLGTLSSLFGDIPYKEAYKYMENRAPAFETQEEVLLDCIADLDSACVLLSKKPTSSYSSLDAMYSGAPAKWAKLANSLRMRFLLRLTGLDETYWTKIQEMVDNPDKYPVFASNEESAIVPFQSVDPYRQYFTYSQEDASSFQNHRITSQLIKMMAILDGSGNDTYTDPRLPIIAERQKGKWFGSESGVNPSRNDEIDGGKSARPNTKTFMNDAFGATIMDYAEVLFIEAEGVCKGKLTVGSKTAKELYEEAVGADIRRWMAFNDCSSTKIPILESDIATFLASDLGSFDVAAAGTGLYGSAEELILSQKWIALIYSGWEQFNEWRRTEYPILTIGDGTATNDFELPTRLAYPNYTVSSNGAHVTSALERMGGANNMHTALDWSYLKRTGSHRNPYSAE